MKKLLVLLLLVFTVTISAQENKEKYFYFNVGYHKGEWKETDTYAVFNYKNNISFLKISINNVSYEYKILNVEEDDEEESLILKCLSLENNDIMRLILYNDRKAGILIVFDNLETLGFRNTKL